MSITRREAIGTGLAAAIGMPLAAKKEKPVNTTAPAAPRDTEPRALVPCHKRNDPREDRFLILVHAIREESKLLFEEHGEMCECGSCDAARGMAWMLHFAEHTVSGELVAWWIFLRPEKGEPVDAADAAQRLNLPVDMVEAFVESEMKQTKRTLDEWEKRLAK